MDTYIIYEKILVKHTVEAETEEDAIEAVNEITPTYNYDEDSKALAYETLRVVLEDEDDDFNHLDPF